MCDDRYGRHRLAPVPGTPDMGGSVSGDRYGGRRGLAAFPPTPDVGVSVSGDSV